MRHHVSSFLGTWCCTSSPNEVSVFLAPVEDRNRHFRLDCRWDSYPLSAAERREWEAEMLPVVLRRARSHVKSIGGTLVLDGTQGVPS